MSSPIRPSTSCLTVSVVKGRARLGGTKVFFLIPFSTRENAGSVDGEEKPLSVCAKETAEIMAKTEGNFRSFAA